MIPPWNAMGFLPPHGANSASSHDRSPYRTDLSDFTSRFAITPERVVIATGLLDYRAALTRLGFTVGFQWINGSFVEDIERIEGRAPRDVDVVSFVMTEGVPMAHGVEGLILDPGHAKGRFHVDAFLVGLDELDLTDLARQAAYWSGLWGHRRTAEWKGFVEVPLDQTQDAAARQIVAQAAATTGGVT